MSGHNEEGKINHDTSEPNSKSIFFAVLITAVSLLLIFVCSRFFYEGTVTSDQNMKESCMDTPSSIQEQREMEKEMLCPSSSNIEFKAGRVMPVSEAMEKVVRQYQ